MNYFKLIKDISSNMLFESFGNKRLIPCLEGGYDWNLKRPEEIAKESTLFNINYPKGPSRQSKANNMNEVIANHRLGKFLKGKIRSSGCVQNEIPVYIITKDTDHEDLTEGDMIYLDKGEGTHIEVFNKRKKAKVVLNLDGKVNSKKTAVALDEKRKINC
ncbi:hypothetical protein FB550_101782 [Neobacillus bataviensis]|uniref:Uncharacterized protein n=1 Tax=Neobacillus bataviensis TaxID=220685 RepID=A0A561DZG0_9BACI|nr:hypothetical protein [Neobacillus bataviensis]TWE08754.1 hypothetical protein FB550_101782 [Neobacillus bataviensis]